MGRKLFFSMAILSLVITSCSLIFDQQAPDTSDALEIQATNTLWVFKYETETRIPTSTLYSTRTPTPFPSNTPTMPTSTQTLTPTDVDWDDLPKLSNLILSADDFLSLNLYATNATKFRLTDITDELAKDCQLDCVKTKYTYADGSVILMIIRTKSHDQAERISANLRLNCLDASFFPSEYTEESDMLFEENSWMIMDHPNWEEKEYYFTDYSGMDYGDVVILLVHKQKFCFDDPEVGFACGDDLSSIASDTSIILSKQADKLRDAGYPE